MGQGYRCVVTGRDGDGKSVVVRDSTVPHGILGIADFWKTSTSPASPAEVWGPSDPVRLEPPRGGTIFRFFEIPRRIRASLPGRPTGPPPKCSPQPAPDIVGWTPGGIR